VTLGARAADIKLFDTDSGRRLIWVADGAQPRPAAGAADEDPVVGENPVAVSGDAR
jgi:hypothetical protein